jgi:hypothetical protein
MRRPLSAIALVFGILSIPSLLGWALLSITAVFGGKVSITSSSDLLGLAAFIAGWSGWAALLWLAANFGGLGLSKLPGWVVVGLVLGIATVVSVWAMSRPGLPGSPGEFVALLLFGGAPFGFAISALLKYAITRRHHAHTYA